MNHRRASSTREVLDHVHHAVVARRVDWTLKPPSPPPSPPPSTEISFEEMHDCDLMNFSLWLVYQTLPFMPRPIFLEESSFELTSFLTHVSCMYRVVLQRQPAKSSTVCN
jgi:hypothetical protein